MDESQFIRLAGHRLSTMSDVLEAYPALEADGDEAMLTISHASGATFVISRHTPTRQLWLSSPVSGGLHFSHQNETDRWVLADGRTIEAVLATDLETATGVRVLLA